MLIIFIYSFIYLFIYLFSIFFLSKYIFLLDSKQYNHYGGRRTPSLPDQDSSEMRSSSSRNSDQETSKRNKKQKNLGGELYLSYFFFHVSNSNVHFF